MEAEAYNYALSLHQRDVQRAGPESAKPAEWISRKAKQQQPDWQQRNKGAVADGRMEPSAEKTVADLMVATNGAESWSVVVVKNGKLRPEYRDSPPAGMPHYLSIVLAGEVPSCDKCGIMVPGLLSLPCACEWSVCAECFEEEVGDFFDGFACKECDGFRKSHKSWLATQPYLEYVAAARA